MTAVPDRLRAALADRYRLERELGAGGMATVYLAEDLKHQRQVAVKVLRPDLAAALGADRFLREVGIAARLTHPHILGLHDSGEADGFLYYVMPYVEGISLRQKLAREGELPVPEAIRILRDLADAMAHAHGQGVVHRDIKPENVMLTGRHALVMDFGVAKALAEGQRPESPRDPAAPLTSVGVALGTPAYMSPEQATGDTHVDARADLYAWGVVAYELLAGQPPFIRSTPQATLAAQATATPEPITAHRENLPGALAALVMQCLEKRAADRPQTAAEIATRLEAVLTPSGGMTPTATAPYQTAAARRAKRRRVLTGAGVVAALAVLGLLGWRFWPRPKVDWIAAPRNPVAVIPFEVRGSAPGLDGLGAQFADQVTAAISQAALGTVVPGRLAREGAATLVTGTITARNDSVEVQAELVRAGDRRTIWILGPERAPLADLGAALGVIKQRILGATGTYLLPDNSTKDVSAWQPPPTLEIFTLSERGWTLFGEENFAQAIPLWEEAFRKDTAYLPSAAALLSALLGARRWAAADSLQAYLQVRSSRMAPRDRSFLEYTVAYHTGSPEQLYQASRALARTDSAAFSFDLMYAAARSGRLEEALRRYAARDTAADWPPWHYHAGEALHGLGRFDEQYRLMRDVRGRYSASQIVWRQQASAMAALGWADSVAALIAASSVLENPNEDGVLMRVAGREFKAHGHGAMADALFARYLNEYVPRFPAPENRAELARQAYVLMGRYDEANRIARADRRWADPGPRGLAWRARNMAVAVMAGDTAGALGMVDTLRSTTIEFGTERPRPLGFYTAAQILSALGRKGEAVVMLRQALNDGYRLIQDEELMWYWAPLRDHTPFLTLVRPRE